MTDHEQPSDDVTTCPNCGAVVVYRGVGRRPVWCSTRCRNDASLRRLGARRGAIEVRVVEVPRTPADTRTNAASPSAVPSMPQPDTADSRGRRAPTPSPEQALRVIRNDPEAVGKLLTHVERRRSDGTLSAPEWLPVRNALRLLAGKLSPGIERPSPPR